MKWLRSLIDTLTGKTMADEAFNRFMLPKIKQLEALGVSTEDIDRLYRHAVAIADPTRVGRAPGSVMAWFVEHIEAGGSVDECLRY